MKSERRENSRARVCRAVAQKKIAYLIRLCRDYQMRCIGIYNKYIIMCAYECARELTTYFPQLFSCLHRRYIPIKISVCVCVCVCGKTFSSWFFFFTFFVNGLFKTKSLEVFSLSECFY